MNDQNDTPTDGRFTGVIADDYDATFPLICPHLDELEKSVGEALVSLHRRTDRAQLRVLDLGSGDGLTTLAILAAARDSDCVGELVALDNEPRMLRALDHNVRKVFTRPPVTIVERDALGYLRSCPGESIDFVGSCFVLHNFLDDYRKQVLAEIFRVLVPGGVFANADKLATEQPLHAQTLRKQLELVIDAYLAAGRPDLMKEWLLHYLDDEVPGRLWFESDAKRQLEDLGFEVSRTFRADMEATLVACKPIPPGN